MHKGHLTLVKCGQWQFEIQIKKQACYPTSLSLSLSVYSRSTPLYFLPTPPSTACPGLDVKYWKSNKPFLFALA